eukprot:scaffold6307_cov111-Isochrysis_galbana.AAC.2
MRHICVRPSRSSGAASLGLGRLDLDRARSRLLLLGLLRHADVKHSKLAAGLHSSLVDAHLRELDALLDPALALPALADALALAFDAEDATIERHLDVLRLDSGGGDLHPAPSWQARRRVGRRGSEAQKRRRADRREQMHTCEDQRAGRRGPRSGQARMSAARERALAYW